MRVLCSPNCLKTKSKNNWAIPAASTVLEQGVRITLFVRPWLTTTMTESNPDDRERLVIRLTESCLKGRETVDKIGQRGGTIGWVLTLFCWQTVQPTMKCLTKVERPGHQKSRSRTDLVWKTPPCGQRGGKSGSGEGEQSGLMGEHTCGCENKDVHCQTSSQKGWHE